MPRNSSDENSRLRVISQVSTSLTGYSLIVPLTVRLPPWALILCSIFVLAYGSLRVIIPQESADRLAWWRWILRRKK
jgi:hypothetical protein